MKRIFLLTTLAIAFTGAHAYDDDDRCNISNLNLAAGIYEPSGACEQVGFVCKLASDHSGSVAFWLGTSADCKHFRTTRITTYFPKQSLPTELDPNHVNHDLRLTLTPGVGNANMFGAAIMASQILSAKSDGAKVSVIYSFIPGPYGADLNSVRLLSVSRVD